jgi:hypothetical protein
MERDRPGKAIGEDVVDYLVIWDDGKALTFTGFLELGMVTPPQECIPSRVCSDDHKMTQKFILKNMCPRSIQASGEPGFHWQPVIPLWTVTLSEKYSLVANQKAVLYQTNDVLPKLEEKAAGP